MSYMKLQAHYVEHHSDGLYVSSPSKTMQLGEGTTVALPIPYIPIDNRLAIAPKLTADGETAAVRIDLTRWVPMYVSPDLVSFLPLACPGQAMAVRAAREFDADPAISWQDSEDDMVRWAHAWIAAGTQSAATKSTGGAA
jgi:hypothetical protein